MKRLEFSIVYLVFFSPLTYLTAETMRFEK